MVSFGALVFVVFIVLFLTAIIAIVAIVRVCVCNLLKSMHYDSFTGIFLLFAFL